MTTLLSFNVYIYVYQ